MCPRTEEQFEAIRNTKKQLILDTALTLFAEHSYHNTSISKIATKAGISKGLIYNYFKSKEDLLQHIFMQIMDNMDLKVNPVEKDEYKHEEAEAFFDSMFSMMCDNPNEWKLYMQLSVQSDVLAFLMKSMSEHQYDHMQASILHFFSVQEYEDPEVAILLFASIVKGFVLQYAFAPEMFPQETVDRFKQKIKDLFIYNLPKKKTIKDLELDEQKRFFLL